MDLSTTFCPSSMIIFQGQKIVEVTFVVICCVPYMEGSWNRLMLGNFSRKFNHGTINRKSGEVLLARFYQLKAPIML